MDKATTLAYKEHPVQALIDWCSEVLSKRPGRQNGWCGCSWVMGVGQGADTEKATPSSDAQMTAGMQASTFSGEKMETKKTGKTETSWRYRRKLVLNVKQWWRAREFRAPAGITDIRTTDAYIPLYHVWSLSHTLALSICQGLQADDSEDTDNSTLDASKVNPDLGHPWLER